MSTRFVYDYYTVAVPVDLSDDPEVLADQAIMEARERTRLYCIPAVWTAVRVGSTGSEIMYSVTRKRNRPIKE